MQIKIKKLHKDIATPKYATDGSACFDIQCFVAPVEVKGEILPVVTELNNGDTITFSTGLQFEIPENHVMLVYSRSGHGFNNNVRLSNCVGVIDSDYRGELKVKLIGDFTNRAAPLLVKSGDRIAQALILPVQQVMFEEVQELSTTDRGEGGFGSTGF